MEGDLGAMRDGLVRSRLEALVLFWVKVRSDRPFWDLAATFGYRDPHGKGAEKASDDFYMVLGKLQKNFVPRHLGPDAFNFADAMKEQTVFSKQFYCDGHDPEKTISLVWDATYLYHYKSKYSGRCQSICR